MNQYCTSAVSNTRAGRPREIDIASRDCQLLDVAADLFLTTGYHQVSIDQIVRAAGVAGRTIYARYGGKAGLLEAVIDRELARQRMHLDSLSNCHDGDDTTFVALAVMFLNGVLSQDSVLLYCDALAKRDFLLGQRLTTKTGSGCRLDDVCRAALVDARRQQRQQACAMGTGQIGNLDEKRVERAGIQAGSPEKIQSG